MILRFVLIGYCNYCDFGFFDAPHTCIHSALHIGNFHAVSKLISYRGLRRISIILLCRSCFSLEPILIILVTNCQFFFSFYSGLEDQLLALVVAEERPDLEEAKNQLIVSNAKMKQELKEIEDKILHKLSASEGSPVDDIDLIHTLEQSKAKSMEIKVNGETSALCSLSCFKKYLIDNEKSSRSL